MAEYIDRETLMRDIDETVIFSGRDGRISAEMSGANKVIDRIKICAVADVAPVVHGKWIGKPIAGYCNIRCSECEEIYYNNGKWNYCPNCGAKMDL